MSHTSSLGRRSFLRATAAVGSGLAIAALPTAGSGAPVGSARLPRPHSPDEALQRLIDGNQRFVSGHTMGMRRDMARVADLADGQEPFAAVLSCADSRVPPELLFDQGFGDVFTVRVAGNVAGTEEVASLEYSVAVLGSMVLMVLGHTSCGAVSAAMTGGPVPGRISALYSHITPAIADAGDDVHAAVIANVRAQAHVISTSSPVVRDAVSNGRLSVVGAVYDLRTGAVDLLDEG